MADKRKYFATEQEANAYLEGQGYQFDTVTPRFFPWVCGPNAAEVRFNSHGYFVNFAPGWGGK